MRQAEKNSRSREQIVACAFAEFAENGFAGGSVNRICARGGISKGLLYHYYSGREELYLACVEKLFADMTDALTDALGSGEVTVESYFAARAGFFAAHPQHRALFGNLLLYPQSALAPEVNRRRAKFDELNSSVLRAVLSREKLSPGITPDGAVEQLHIFVDFLGVSLRESGGDFEEKAAALLHTMLYGLIAR